jgi:hypothetical protein
MHSVGAHCGKSARWVLCGGTSTRDHAGSVRALARKRQQPRGSAKATVSRLVSTYLNDYHAARVCSNTPPLVARSLPAARQPRQPDRAGA